MGTTQKRNVSERPAPQNPVDVRKLFVDLVVGP